MTRSAGILLLSLSIFCLASCQSDPILEQDLDFGEDMMFPSIDYPSDNPFSEDAWLLGKNLFYDTRLSKDKTKSCASCHNPRLAFSDDKPTSPGVFDRPGTRNSSPLFNVAYHPYFTREGGVATLETQVLVPIQEHNEFNTNIVDLAEMLRNDSLYQKLSLSAYGREMDHFVITRAIATFERSLISKQSRFDAFYAGDETALSALEKDGMRLFFSPKTNCSTCHGGFNFTNYAFANNGLYVQYIDEGRKRLTGMDSDRALFKTPSLRNVEVTAPYMHDGSLNHLEEVVHRYNIGGADHPNKNGIIKALNLSKVEEEALVAFLKSLTDHSFLNNKKLQKK